MIADSTIDKINAWANNKYAGSAAPSLTAAAQPNANAGGGMLSAGGATGIGGPSVSSTTQSVSTASPAGMLDAGSGSAPANQPAAPATAAASAPAAATVEKPFNAADAMDDSMSKWKYANYNGQQVRVDDQEKQNMNDAVVGYNKIMGTNLTGQQYDEMINPKTAGARYGRADPQTGTTPGTTATGATGASTLNPTDLSHRTVDPNETVNGQLGKVLSQDGLLMQQARQGALRSANERGMLNSAMAASAGEDAAIRSALQVATPDAAAYGRASDYNAAAENQARMFNATAQNDFAKFQMQLDADNKARGQQMTIAQMQDATSRYSTETNSATSKYNTDTQYKQQADNAKKSLTNNIIANMDLSPDRKAAMLEQLGEGTSAKRNPDGSITPGTGLAGAVYVIDSVSADLNFANMSPQQQAAYAAGQVVG